MGEYLPPLLKKYPKLQAAIPWMSLGRFPTPVEKMSSLGQALGLSELWVKKDNLTGDKYGGNKVRKLEFTLADAKKQGRDTVITLGGAGSNHVLATTIYARDLGINTVGLFGAQANQEYLRTNILCNCMMGCEIIYSDSNAAQAVIALYEYGKRWISGHRPYFLWAGGSNAPGVLGYVNAALEIAQQVQENRMPEPDYIFVPMGSCGTFAGLVLGAKLAGLKTRCIGVQVFDGFAANAAVTRYLANAAFKLIRAVDSGILGDRVTNGDFVVLKDFFGKGYACYTTACMEAMELIKKHEGIELEGTYSGKCLAGLISYMALPSRKDKVALFINTYNSVDLSPILKECEGYHVLPKPLHKYFETDFHPVED